MIGNDIIFWTFNLNMHVTSMFEELGKMRNVTVVYYDRGNRDLGEIPFKHIKLLHISSNAEVDEVISKTRNCIHVNRNVKRYRNVVGPELFSYALHRLLKEKCFVITLYMEQYYWWGVKGFLRRIKWGHLFNIGYLRRYKAIGCCGKTGLEAHRKAWIPDRRLFDFIYTVPTSDSYLLQSFTMADCNSALPYYRGKRFVFIGSFVNRKSIIELIEVFNSIEDDYEFNIIGTGPLNNTVADLIANNDKIHLLGKLMPLQVRNVLKESDTLILPSKSEGWGCVVNEALMSGCRVIVSDVVGARALIDKEGTRGQIFKSCDWQDLKRCIIKEMNRQDCDDQQHIAEWAKAIYPQTEAKYFIQVLDYIQGKGEKPLAPWV